MNKTLLILILIIFISACIRPISDRGRDDGMTKDGKFYPELPSCTGNVFFNTTPINLFELNSVTPLGNMEPPSHTFPTDHIYFHMGNTQNTPVYAPGDIWITNIASSAMTSPGENKTDYSIDFSPCAEFSARWYHIDALSGKLAAELKKGSPEGWCQEYDTGGRHYKMCGNPMMVELKAGEVIGYVFNDGYGATFDLGARDMRTEPMDYANLNRWYDAVQHIVCPLDYFEEETKQDLYSYFKTMDIDGTPRTIEPICGEVAQDVAGTAQGVWFAVGTKGTYPEDPHVALAHDNYDPRIGVFSMGNIVSQVGIQSGTYLFDPADTGNINTDFDKVTEGSVHCYEDFHKDRFGGARDIKILVELVDGNLRVGKTESCEESSELDEYVEFER